MPPTSTKKGAKSAGAREQRSSSRHSTPVSALTDTTAPPTPVMATPTSTANMPRETAYLHTSTAALISQDPSIETMIDGKSGSKPGDPPSSRDLHALHDKIRDTVNKFMSKRSETCDRSLRLLMQKRKERIQAEQEEEIARQQDEAARVKREDEDVERKKVKKPSKKRSHDEMDVDEDEEKMKKKKESLPSVGAHGPARQDGVGLHEGEYLRVSFISKVTCIRFSQLWLRMHSLAYQYCSHARWYEEIS
nr:hypothetical protein CFP56_24537 [Quercus suber]